MITPSPFGQKHSCLNCSGRFYDLNKQPAICPKCGQKVRAVINTGRKAKRRKVEVIATLN